MDYNLILNEQTQAGFRIFGSNADLTLSDDDIGKSLVFHKITADDDDFTKYQSKLKIKVFPSYDLTVISAYFKVAYHQIFCTIMHIYYVGSHTL